MCEELLVGWAFLPVRVTFMRRKMGTTDGTDFTDSGELIGSVPIRAIRGLQLHLLAHG